MSSLVTSASLWNNDDSNNNMTKKRIPTIRKTQKQRPFAQPMTENYSDEQPTGRVENYQNLQPYSISDVQTATDERNVKINDLLNKITSTDTQQDNNSKMGQFNPVSPPEINVKKDSPSDILPRQYIPQMPSFVDASISSKNANFAYAADDTKTGSLSNYSKSYEPPSKVNAATPYYAKMGLGNAPPDDKLMDKINYMIHLMEQQQNEKTSNITEEFILYTFLGVFIIYIVDSFSRTGKYVR